MVTKKDDNLRMTPAAVSALVAGDLINFLAAATPGGIEAQEAAGQKALVNHADRLPTDGTVSDPIKRAQWEAVGFVFGEPLPGRDSIFVACAFPAGWVLKPTNHSMWSDVLDPAGRRRAMVFFKAAFYDYKSHTFGLEPRYRAGGDYINNKDWKDRRMVYYVTDTADGIRLVEFTDTEQPPQHVDSPSRTKVGAWLAEHYPDHKDPLAYWEPK